MIGQWRSLGPTLIAEALGATGRVTTLAIDETNPSTIYAAGRSGNPAGVGGCGVWKTTDTGSTWRPIADGLPFLRVAAVALAPGASSPLYAAILNRSERGGGLYRSGDGGGTWELISDDEALSGRQLLIDPTNPSRMFMENGDAVHRSLDAGATWSSLFGPAGARVTDLVMDLSTPSRMYAGVSHPTSDTDTGVYATRDSGDSWIKLVGCPGGSLPTGMAGRVIRLAVSRGRVYATFKNREQFVLYRTTGISCSIGGRLESGWERGWTAGSDVAPTMFSYLYAHPGNPDIVYATGTSFRRSTNGGLDFSVMSGPHADHHAFAVDPSDDNIVYTGCDGGLYRSNNRGASGSWSFVGEGMTNTEFYDIGHAPTDPRLLLGGTQDNGTIRIRESGTVWDEIRGGDGATVDVDPTDAGILYSMGQFAPSIARRSGGGGWEGLAAGLPVGSFCFNLHYQVHPRVPTTLLASCEAKLWRTTTNQPPGDWRAIFPVPGTPSPTGAVVRSAVDGRSDIYYAATSTGELFAGVNGGGWERVFNLATDCAGGAAVTIVDVEVDLDNPALVYVATAGRQTCRVLQLRRTTANALALTARDITSDLSADVIVSALAIDRLNAGTIYAGTTDRAVYRGRSLGGIWRWDRYSDGLPLAACIVDLLAHPVTGALRAGTCGRGAFEVDTDHPVGSILAIEGFLTFLRAHDVGTGFGPPTDPIDAEVVVQLDTAPGRGFGFQLRADQNEAARRGMLDTLRTAFNANRRVRLEYRRTGVKNGVLLRVADLS